jgi:predicted ATPase
MTSEERRQQARTMITQIEIDGFKTFKDFKVELAPFQVIVGPNGSGKSNLFDALHLLSRLMEDDLATAFQRMRGRDFEQFTNLSEGKYVDKIRLAVEMLVDRKVRDDLGQDAQLRYTRLRYEVEITQGTDDLGLDRLFVTHESLASIPQDNDQWRKKYGLVTDSDWIPAHSNRQARFISSDATSTRTEFPPGRTVIQPVILLHSDSDQDNQVIKNIFHSRDILRTVLSSITKADFPHAFATREELRSLRFLHLNPEVLRQPGSLNSPRFLGADGSNLPTTLVRMQSEDKLTWANISLDLANVVPDLTHIELRRDKAQNTYTIWAHYQDGRSFSSRVLSDGTLQLLALITLKNDPQFHGVLCFEEPENGVHPTSLKDIADLLKELTTNFTDLQQTDEPLKQVLVTTHSLDFISQPGIIEALLFTYTMTHVEPESSKIPPIRVTHAAPVVIPDILSTSGARENFDKAEASFTLDQVIELLTNNPLGEALDLLTRTRSKVEEN